MLVQCDCNYIISLLHSIFNMNRSYLHLSDCPLKYLIVITSCDSLLSSDDWSENFTNQIRTLSLKHSTAIVSTPEGSSGEGQSGLSFMVISTLPGWPSGKLTSLRSCYS